MTLDRRGGSIVNDGIIHFIMVNCMICELALIFFKKENELLIYATIRMKLENIMQS
jgi:hypothetical protein